LSFRLLGLLLLAGCSELAVKKYLQEAQDAAERVATPDVPCGDEITTPAPTGCINGYIKCGESIEATTVGGESRWDDDFYASKFCFPAKTGHPAPERAYVLELPDYMQATIQLQSDCVDLDLSVMSWNYQGSCPDIRHAVFTCDASDKRGWDEVLIQNFSKRTYLIGVDGKGQQAGAFRLVVTCEKMLRPEERTKF
jgi:hypothetical protein